MTDGLLQFVCVMGRNNMGLRPFTALIQPLNYDFVLLLGGRGRGRWQYSRGQRGGRGGRGGFRRY